MQVASPPFEPHRHHPAYVMNSLHRDHQPIYQSAAQPTPSSASNSRKRKRIPQLPPVRYHTEREYDGRGELREILVIEDTPPPQLLATPVPSGTGLTPSISTIFSSSSAAGVRTRAQAAAAASQNDSLPPIQPPASSVNGAAPPAKRRKKETFADDTVGAGSSRHVNGNGAGPSSSSAYARKAIASRAYENTKQTAPGASAAASWAGQGSGGTESVRESQVSQASTQAQPVPSPVYDDKDGYYIITPNDMIGNPPRCEFQKFIRQ